MRGKMSDSPHKAALAPVDSPLWQFSLLVYRHELVKVAALQFQDREGINVNLLFLCCWLAYTAEEIDYIRLKLARAIIAQWHEELTTPLRKVRRLLKKIQKEGDNEAVPLLYKMFLGYEVASESHQQKILFGFFEDRQKEEKSKNEVLACRYIHWLFDYEQIIVDKKLARRIHHFVKLVYKQLH